MQTRFCCIFLCLFFLMTTFLFPISAVNTESSGVFTDIDAKSAILVEASTGKVLFEKNADEPLPPASVTKIMTVLLVLEAVDSGSASLSDTIRVSDYASTMGGSQVYLKAGEEMSLEDLLKSVIVASANDAAVALAEHICGSEQAFVARMNERAAALGMKNTVFKNTNGLDDEDTGHLTSARDIAIMSRELLKHPKVFDYTTIWMDSIRDGAFGLTNTNRLIRFYRGCTGLKTGSTSKAGFCISATAQRDGMHLICVIMGSSTKDARNALAASLLDHGFSTWSLTEFPAETRAPITVRGGTKNLCAIEAPSFSALVRREDAKNIKYEISCADAADAPLCIGDKVGQITYSIGDEILGTVDITAADDVPRIGFRILFGRLLSSFVLGVSNAAANG